MSCKNCTCHDCIVGRLEEKNCELNFRMLNFVQKISSMMQRRGEHNVMHVGSCRDFSLYLDECLRELWP